MGALPDVRGLSAAEVIAIISQLSGRKNIALGELAEKGWLEWYGKLWGFGSSGEIVALPQDGSGSLPISAPSSLPVTETKNSYVWEMVYSEENITADASPGTVIFDGTQAGKYILIDDCDAWAFEVYRQTGGAGVATLDVIGVGSMDGGRWWSGETYATNVSTSGFVISAVCEGTKYRLLRIGGKYASIQVKVNTQAADLFTVRLWRRRKQ